MKTLKCFLIVSSFCFSHTPSLYVWRCLLRGLFSCNQTSSKHTHSRTTLFPIFSSRLINSSMDRKEALETLALSASVATAFSVCKHHATTFGNFLNFLSVSRLLLWSQMKTRNHRPILREAIRLGRIQLENYTNSQRFYLYPSRQRQKMFLN